MNSVISYYTTSFGELWEKSLFDLVRDAIKGVLKESSLENNQIDAVFFGNMLGGVVDNTVLSSGHIAEILGTTIPIYRTEGACASGGLAFNLADQYLSTNPDKTVLVVGAEKMTDVSVEDVTKGLGAAASIDEQEAGLTFPGLYGMIAHVYMQKYGYAEEHLAAISVKNHDHGTLNDKAQFRKKVTLEQVLASPYVASPLKMLDSSPISDGAAALVLSNKQSLTKKKNTVSILSSATAADTVSLAKRKQIEQLEATTVAAKKAFKEAKISPKDIQLAEVHDCFSIAEILAMEDMGFWERGSGGNHALNMDTHRDSGNKLIVNSSGGLKSAGHPVGATGIKQLGELYLQLTGQAEKRQISNVHYGLAHNVGGSGGVAVVCILGV